MRLKSVLLATMLAFAATAANAGSFQPLSTSVAGEQDLFLDPAFIQATSFTYLAGHDDTRLFAEGGTGNVVATAINYRTFDTSDFSNTLSTGTLTLLDWNVTKGVDLAPGSAQADIYDFVYRDSSDNSLVFGTRYLNVKDNNQEANFLYRYGFTGHSTSVAWTFLTDSDLRLYNSDKTNSTSSTASVFDQDVVRQQSDVSLTEDHPWSGLYLVKTDATSYTVGNKAIGFYQAGEEGQNPTGGFIAGFVATSVTPVPEPESFALMMLGLSVIASARRQKKQA